MIPWQRWLLMIFAVMSALGAADFLAGDRRGLGRKFLEGLQTFAPLFLTMAGFLVLTPLLAKVLTPLVTPLFSAVGADPGLFAGIFLANDNGAYALAAQLSPHPEGACFGGMLLGSLLGANVVCMPLILQLMAKEDYRFYFSGLMFGMMTMPLALVAGALAAGCRWQYILHQLPVLLALAGGAALLLWLCPERLVRALTALVRLMQIVSLSGASLAIFAELSGIAIPGLAPIGEALRIIGTIVIVLPGVYVLTEVLNRVLRRPLAAAGRRIGVNEAAMGGFLASLANAIPTMTRLREMDPRGKMLNCAFLFSGAFVLGDHLAFCGAVAPELIGPLFVTKFTGGITAALLAWQCYPTSFHEKRSRQEKRSLCRVRPSPMGYLRHLLLGNPKK